MESGRAILDRAFQRLAVSPQLDLEALARALERKSLNDLYVAIGTGECSMTTVLNVAMQSGSVMRSQQSDLPLEWAAQVEAIGDTCDRCRSACLAAGRLVVIR
jgi:(p)ppGpp synthase/HD superfamily hydrolase